jgi:hypothetical protein
MLYEYSGLRFDEKLVSVTTDDVLPNSFLSFSKQFLACFVVEECKLDDMGTVKITYVITTSSFRCDSAFGIFSNIQIEHIKLR